MRQQVAKIVYDSARASELTGCRGGMGEKRSIGFLADPLCVEMMIDEDLGGLYICTGQVLNRGGTEPLAGVRVGLGAKGEASTKTDDYGEFTLGGQLDCSAQVLVVYGDDVDVVCRVPALDGC